MSIKEGDFIRIKYVGRIKDTNEIFDLNDEDVAKKEDIFDEDRVYKPAPIIVGAKHVIEGLDESLVGMEVDEEKKIEVLPEKGFGKRRDDFVKIIPLSFFKKQKLKPFPGMKLTIDGKLAKVQTVSGGRVRVDFNPEMAGKNIIYDIKIIEKIEDLEEKIKAVLELHLGDTEGISEIKIENGIAYINLTDKVKLHPRALHIKLAAASDALKHLNELNEIKYIESFERDEVEKLESREESAHNHE